MLDSNSNRTPNDGGVSVSFSSSSEAFSMASTNSTEPTSLSSVTSSPVKRPATSRFQQNLLQRKLRAQQKQIRCYLDIHPVTSRISIIPYPIQLTLESASKISSMKVLSSPPITKLFDLLSSLPNSSSASESTHSRLLNLLHSCFVNAYLQRFYCEQALLIDYGFLEEYFSAIEKYQSNVSQLRASNISADDIQINDIELKIDEDTIRQPSDLLQHLSVPATTPILSLLADEPSIDIRLCSGRLAFNKKSSSIPTDTLSSLASFPIETLICIGQLTEHWLKSNPNHCVILALPKEISALLTTCILYSSGQSDSVSSALRRVLRFYHNRFLTFFKHRTMLSVNKQFFNDFATIIPKGGLGVQTKWATPRCLITNLIIHHLPCYERRGCRLLILFIQGSSFLYTTMQQGGGHVWVPSTAKKAYSVDVPMSVNFIGNALLKIYHMPEDATVHHTRQLVCELNVNSATLYGRGREGRAYFCVSDFQHCTNLPSLHKHFNLELLFDLVKSTMQDSSTSTGKISTTTPRNRVFRYYLEDAVGNEVYGTASSPNMSEALRLPNGDLVEEEEKSIEIVPSEGEEAGPNQSSPMVGPPMVSPLMSTTIPLDASIDDPDYRLARELQLQFDQETHPPHALADRRLFDATSPSHGSTALHPSSHSHQINPLNSNSHTIHTLAAIPSTSPLANPSVNVRSASSSADDDDEILARQLQAEFDWEYQTGMTPRFEYLNASGPQHSFQYEASRLISLPMFRFGPIGISESTDAPLSLPASTYYPNVSVLPEFTCEGGHYLQEECQVCKETFCVGESLRVLQCFHPYHKECIDRWLVNHFKCPVCKMNAFPLD